MRALRVCVFGRAYGYTRYALKLLYKKLSYR